MPTEAYLALAAVLFALGLTGVIARKTALSALVGAQLMLDAAILAVAVAGQRYADVSADLVTVAFIVAGAVTSSSALAIALDVTRRGPGPDTDRPMGEA